MGIQVFVFIDTPIENNMAEKLTIRQLLLRKVVYKFFKHSIPNYGYICNELRFSAYTYSQHNIARSQLSGDGSPHMSLCTEFQQISELALVRLWAGFLYTVAMSMPKTAIHTQCTQIVCVEASYHAQKIISVINLSTIRVRVFFTVWKLHHKCQANC